MDTARHEPTCRVRRHSHVQHLLTADESSLTELEVALAVLPICATGRVFIEVPDASWIGPVDAPARMVVTWLDRSSRASASGPGASCRPGVAVARAVAAWADEMLCGEGSEVGQTRVLLLGGARGTGMIVSHLTGRLDVDPAVIHTASG